jgi:hypothetical protein
MSRFEGINLKNVLCALAVFVRHVCHNVCIVRSRVASSATLATTLRKPLVRNFTIGSRKKA